MQPCKWCQAEFEPAETNQIYCGPQCYEAASNYKATQRYIAKHGEVTERPCEFCQAPFLPVRRDSRFCSKLCQGRSRRAREADCDDISGDPERWAVSTPYGSHGFDSFVAASFQRSAHV